MRQLSSRTQAFDPHVIRLHGTLLDGSGSRGVDGTIIRRFAEAGCRPAQQDAIAAGADSSIPSTARTVLCACAAAALAERPDLPILLTDRLCGNRIGVDGGAGVRMSNPHRLPGAELDSSARPRADRGSLLAPGFGAGSGCRKLPDLKHNFCFSPTKKWSAPADGGLKCLCRDLEGEPMPFGPATHHCELRDLLASDRPSVQGRRRHGRLVAHSGGSEPRPASRETFASRRRSPIA